MKEIKLIDLRTPARVQWFGDESADSLDDSPPSGVDAHGPARQERHNNRPNMQKPRQSRGFKNGEGGIRTLGPVSRTQHFQCCTIGHSATSPAYTISASALADFRCSVLLGTTLHHGSLTSLQSGHCVQTTSELTVISTQMTPGCVL